MDDDFAFIDHDDQSDSGQPPIPSLRRIQFEIAPRGLTGFINQSKKCRSASKKLIEILKKLTCSCGEIFTKTNLPLIANCGHYVCASHKNDAKPFECMKFCGVKTDSKSFLIDNVLEDFYKAIQNHGFRCQECSKYHPRQNSVQCMKNMKQPDSPYMCVWCAIKDDNYEKYDLRSIENERMGEEDMDLISLDRTEHPAGWALNFCCVCEDSLHKPRDPDPKLIVHLYCDHICHEYCPEKDNRFSNDMKERVKCRLCGHESLRRQMKKRTTHAKKDLNELRGDQEYQLCGKCHQKHPNSNISKYGDVWKCVWCYLETKEDEPMEKEKKVNEKRSNANGSNQSNSPNKKCLIV